MMEMTRADAIEWIRAQSESVINEYCSRVDQKEQERADCDEALRALGCTDEELRREAEQR